MNIIKDNYDFTTKELVKLYNLLMDNSDSCENLELKNKITSMLNQRIEEGREIIDLSKEYKARKIDRETGQVVKEGTMNSKGGYKWND